MKIFNDKVSCTYDIEVFKNVFMITFKNLDTGEISQFSMFKYENIEIDDLKKLVKFVDRDVILIGYNNELYDNTILNYIIANYKKTRNKLDLLTEIYNLSGEISEFMKARNNKLDDSTEISNIGSRNIDDDLYNKDVDTGIVKTKTYNIYKSSDNNFVSDNIRKYRYYKNIKYKSIDLFLMMAFNKLGVGLKQCAINLKHGLIQDLPYNYDKLLTYDEYLKLFPYNVNDVDITEKLLKNKSVLEGIELRIELSEKYDLNLLSASDSKIGNIIFTDKYSEYTGISSEVFSKDRTIRKYIRLRDCISKDIKFNNPTLVKLLDDINNTIVYFSTKNPSKILEVLTYKKKVYTRKSTESYKKSRQSSVLKPGFETSVTLGNKQYDVGLGGIHSRDECDIYEAKEGYRLIDGDVDSFYPFIMLNNEIYPNHLDPRFLEIFKDIVDTRIKAKKTASTNFHDKITAESLKITINALFGKLGFLDYYLFDMKALFSVTLNGQLYLLMIIEQLLEAGIEVISANTDGIICYFHESLSDVYYNIFNTWAVTNRFGISYTEYKKYIRTDINNYITVGTDNKIKDKGLFVRDINLKKGYNMPIIARALYEYFINDKSVENIVYGSNDILEFCMSQKANKKYQMRVHYVENGEYKIRDEQRSIRFYASNTGVSIIKTENKKSDTPVITSLLDNSSNNSKTSKGINLLSGEYATIINDYIHHDNFKDYNINYNYYIREINNIINQIKKGSIVKGRSAKGMKQVKKHYVENKQLSLF